MRMPRTILAVAFLAGLFALGTPRPAEAAVSVSVSFFHEQLSPHGRWVVAGSYGDVWVPSGVTAGWAPYVDGEWVYTDYGWTWIAEDPWGDIPYHYGTWVWVDGYGWAWVPGTVWAPAWVTWAYTDDFIGWAPVPPTFVLSARGYFGRPIVVSETRYIFVPARQFIGVRVSSVRLPPQQNATIFTRAKKVTNFQVSHGIVRTVGPPASHIEKVMGRRIERVPVDRVKTRPTTIAQAGLTKAKSLRVVVPQAERARAIKGNAAERQAADAPAKAPAKEPRTAGKAAKPERVVEKPQRAQAVPKHEAASSSEPKAAAQPRAAGKPEGGVAREPTKPQRDQSPNKEKRPEKKPANPETPPQ